MIIYIEGGGITVRGIRREREGGFYGFGEEEGVSGRGGSMTIS